jgi:hypothetical protein
MMNNIKPDISLFGSSYRPENWMNLYRSIGENDVRFEIIFVGPNEPDFELQPNIKFIKSFVKPSQCFEIAARNTAADLIMNMPDDVEFKTERPLDRLYCIYKSHNNEKLIVSCRYKLDGEDFSDECHHFFVGDRSSPILSLSGLLSKRLYREVGGVDRNFLTVMADNDITMRVHANGGEVILSDVYLEEYKRKGRGSQLCEEYWNHERGLLLDLWVVDGKLQSERVRSVEPFSDSKIVEVSQGPRGRWRGSSPAALEKLVDAAHFCFVELPRRSPSIFRVAYHIIKNFDKYPEYAKKIFLRLFFRKKPVREE